MFKTKLHSIKRYIFGKKLREFVYRRFCLGWFCKIIGSFTIYRIYCSSFFVKIQEFVYSDVTARTLLILQLGWTCAAIIQSKNIKVTSKHIWVFWKMLIKSFPLEIKMANKCFHLWSDSTENGYLGHSRSQMKALIEHYRSTLLFLL